MSEQYYLDPRCSKVDGDLAVLGGDESHHFLRVLRGKPGDAVQLFDGNGTRFHGVVESVRKSEINIRITETKSDATEHRVRLTIATALPKGDRQKFLIEKLTELGVAELIPLRTDRGVSKADADVLERLRRQVVEASKQSSRSVLMQIAEEQTLAELGASFDSKYLLHPVSDSVIGQMTLRSLISVGVPDKIVFVVGPEGGFTETETISASEHGFQPVDLGPRILRTETACIAVAAALLCVDRQ